ncbi:MAG: aminotransferase class III-fold pyridoxal phosphate-dependent enzyme [Deltaproteobacteria bacterium]|jgi:acetylornithine/succinyldiaminopimelate/putrescine aminotransferase/predicted amino acid dehydrogenase|nr:aminotransferase class III-fold pyridoxal phosphate-dependent enzyme [Deltaproteobacteria bacterium]
MNNPELTTYEKYVNPLQAKLLKANGVEKTFIKAEGHTLTYKNAKGETGSIIDCLCGYGSLMFGHNHPRIHDTVKDFLNNKTPIHTQFAPRPITARLAERLSGLAEKYLDEDYVVRFANSGAEAVDLAIKHAEFQRVLKVQELTKKLDQKFNDLEARWNDGEVEIPGELFAETELREQIFADTLTPGELRGYISRLNSVALSSRPIIFALKKAFHGKSVAAAQMTHNETFRRAFLYFGMQTVFIDHEDLSEIEFIMDEVSQTFYDFVINKKTNQISLVEKDYPAYTAAIIEPIQGEGGIHAIPGSTLRDFRNICDHKNFPLIFDEIQCGMGRSGTLFACQPHDVAPDMVLFAKSIGGGVAKNAAVLIKRANYEDAFGIIHSSTFAEDELSASVALTVFDMLEEDEGAAYERATELGNRLMEGFRELSRKYPGTIKEVRGIGLMIGVEFFQDVDADSAVVRLVSHHNRLGYSLFSYLQEVQGIRAVPTASAPSTLRLEPGVTLTDDEVDTIIQGFEGLCKTLYYQDSYQLLQHVGNQDRSSRDHKIRDYRRDEVKQKRAHYKEKSRVGVPKIGFIAHVMDPVNISDNDPALERLTNEERAGIYNANNVTIMCNAPSVPKRITASFGKEVDVQFYILSRTASQVLGDLNGPGLDDLREAIYDTALQAKKDGCTAFGLGMFTSVVTNNGKALPRVPGMPYTSGNALTTGMGFKAMQEATEKTGKQLDGCTAAVVGGAGNIGQVYSALLAERVAHLMLVGSGRAGSVKRLSRAYHRVYETLIETIRKEGKESLSGLALDVANLTSVQDFIAELGDKDMPKNTGKDVATLIQQEFGTDPFVTVTDSLATIASADIVVCAASASEPFVGSDIVKHEAVVVDIGVPLNAKQDVKDRHDVTYMQGGLAKLPFQQEMTETVKNLPHGTVYGCVAETMLMGLSGSGRNFSFGDITRKQVKEVTALAESYGFAATVPQTRGL